MRAMTMLDKAEVQYNDLMRKKATVETDKAKIQKVLCLYLCQLILPLCRHSFSCSR